MSLPALSAAGKTARPTTNIFNTFGRKNSISRRHSIPRCRTVVSLVPTRVNAVYSDPRNPVYDVLQCPRQVVTRRSALTGSEATVRANLVSDGINVLLLLDVNREMIEFFAVAPDAEKLQPFLNRMQDGPSFACSFNSIP